MNTDHEQSHRRLRALDLDEIEKAYAGHLRVENLGASITEFSKDRRCPYCGARILEMEMYRQHVRRANRTGFCLGQGPPGPSISPNGTGEHNHHFYLVPQNRPHDMVKAIPRGGSPLRTEFEADQRYRVVGYEEAMDLASRSGWLVSPCWCGGDGFSKRAERHPNGAIGRKLRAQP